MTLFAGIKPHIFSGPYHFVYCKYLQRVCFMKKKKQYYENIYLHYFAYNHIQKDFLKNPYLENKKLNYYNFLFIIMA